MVMTQYLALLTPVLAIDLKPAYSDMTRPGEGARPDRSGSLLNAQQGRSSRRRANIAAPSRPKPSRASVAGSGTTATPLLKPIAVVL
jgi:hypothetical protein